MKSRILLIGLALFSTLAFGQSTQVGNLKVLGNITSLQNLINGYATTATSGGTTTLTVLSAGQQYFTGSSNQTCLLPVVSTLVLGQRYQIINNSSGTVTVNTSGGNTLQAMAASTRLMATVIAITGTNIASWAFEYAPNLGGGVTSVALSVPSFLSISGSPVTTSGTLAIGLSGTALPILNGGTGQTTANAALNALLPTQTSNAGKFLKTDATNSSWASVVATAAYNITTQTSNYTAVANDYVLASGAAFNLTLPTAVGVNGQSIVLKKTDSSLANIITVATTSGQTVDGLGTGVVTANTLNELYVFTSDNANWQISEHKTATGWSSPVAVSLTATSAYVFTVTSANATVGAVYSSGGFNFTVTTTIAAGVSLTCSGTGTPGASGSLVKVSGVGDATITFSSKTTTGVPVFGTSTTNSLRWRRSANIAHIQIRITQTGAGTNGSGDYIVFLPTGLVADTTINPVYLPVVLIPTTSAAYPSQFQSSGIIEQTGSSLTYTLAAYIYSSTSFRVAGYNSSAGTYNWGTTGGTLGNTDLGVALDVFIPISGWQP